jgi:hypothetical protein
MTAKEAAQVIRTTCEKSADAFLDVLETPIRGKPSITVHDRDACRRILIGGLCEITVSSMSLAASTGHQNTLRLLREAVEARSTLEMPSDNWLEEARDALRKAGEG